MITLLEETHGVPFSVCIKPEKWDGNQYYNLIAPQCDYIVPMLYLADYEVGISHLKSLINFITTSIRGKLWPDFKLMNLTRILLLRMQHYTRVVIRFRYGLSNFHR